MVRAPRRGYPSNVPGDQDEPLDQRDYSRRTLLASERTFLAWWRTGLTAITAGLAAAQLVPKLADSGSQWAYTTLGALLTTVGIVCILYGEYRRIAVTKAIREGNFEEASGPVTGIVTAIGALVGIGLLVLIVATS